MQESNKESAYFSNLECAQLVFKSMSCIELSNYLAHNWESLWEGRRAYLSTLMVERQCAEAVVYLVRLLDSHDPVYRQRALYGLSQLGRREQRGRFIEMHLHDPDPDVRRSALADLGQMFHNERDLEILRLALAAFESPVGDVGMKLTAGATMMYQLGISHDEQGRPAWWDEDNVDDLQHPAIQQAVAQTRMVLKISS